jgi:hypothetical protein
VRAGFQIAPGELAATGLLELEIQRHGVVIVLDLERLSGRQRIEGAEDQRVSL